MFHESFHGFPLYYLTQKSMKLKLWKYPVMLKESVVDVAGPHQRQLESKRECGEGIQVLQMFVFIEMAAKILQSTTGRKQVM